MTFWSLPHISFNPCSKLHRELTILGQLARRSEHVWEEGRYHADVEIAVARVEICRQVRFSLPKRSDYLAVRILVVGIFEYVKRNAIISRKQFSYVQMTCVCTLGPALRLVLHFSRSPRMRSPLGTPQLALALPFGQHAAPFEHYRVSPHTRESTARALNVRFRVHEGGEV